MKPDVLLLKNRILSACGYGGALSLRAYPYECLRVDGEGTEVAIGYASTTDLARGIALSVMHIRRGEQSFHIREKRRIEKNGVMLDCSYEGMPTVKTLKLYIDYMAAMGLNRLMLYTEDTYEVKEHPEMGYQRGRYTQAELREIDTYAAEMGVELVGCIQTLSHLSRLLQWDAFADIANDSATLLCDEERTYEFIENCIRAISESIRSRTIHIGLDEAFDVAGGRYKKIHGASDGLSVYTRHVRRVYAICKKYGLSPMMWSDCFFRYSMKEPSYGIQYSANEPIPEAILAAVPRDLGMVYWEYEEQSEAVYDAIIKAHAPLGGAVTVATAAWTWDGQLPYIDYTFKTQVPALEAALKNGIRSVLCTVWQCGGHAGDYFFTLPSLALYGQYAYEGADTREAAVAELLESTASLSLSALRLCDIYHDPRRFVFHGGEKYLTAPLLVNTLCSTENPAEAYLGAAEKMRSYKSERFGMLYSFAADLLELTGLKCELLNTLAPAYKAGDRQALRICTEEKLTRVLALLLSLREQRQKRWLEVQKPYGFFAINQNYGRAIAEMEYTLYRLRSYLSGEVDFLEELEAEILPLQYADDKKFDYDHI